MTMNTQGRPTAPESVSMSSIETVSGSRGLLQHEDLLFEIGTPETSGRMVPAVRPNEWNIGSTPTSLSRWSNGTIWAIASQLACRLVCVSSMPLGSPVLPLLRFASEED